MGKDKRALVGPPRNRAVQLEWKKAPARQGSRDKAGLMPEGNRAKARGVRSRDDPKAAFKAQGARIAGPRAAESLDALANQRRIARELIDELLVPTRRVEKGVPGADQS